MFFWVSLPGSSASWPRRRIAGRDRGPCETCGDGSSPRRLPPSATAAAHPPMGASPPHRSSSSRSSPSSPSLRSTPSQPVIARLPPPLSPLLLGGEPFQSGRRFPSAARGAEQRRPEQISPNRIHICLQGR